MLSCVTTWPVWRHDLAVSRVALIRFELAAFEVTTDYTVKHQKECEHGRYIATTQS